MADPTPTPLTDAATDEHEKHTVRWGRSYDGRGGIADEEHGGLRCSCGWDSGPQAGVRPWREWHAHVAGLVVAAARADERERVASRIEQGCARRLGMTASAREVLRDIVRAALAQPADAEGAS